MSSVASITEAVGRKAQSTARWAWLQGSRADHHPACPPACAGQAGLGGCVSPVTPLFGTLQIGVCEVSVGCAHPRHPELPLPRAV